MLISQLALQLTEKYGQRVLPKHIRQLEARGLIPAVPRVGPFRLYGPAEAARVEEALRRAGRLPAKEACSAVA
jgi:hypothetical protein